MLRKLLAMAALSLLPAIAFAQSQTQGLTVMSSCNSSQLNNGGMTNTNVYEATRLLLGPTWVIDHSGYTVVARFGDGTQAVFTINTFGTMNEKTPGGGCTPQDTSGWNWYSPSTSGSYMDWASGDVVHVDGGIFTGGPFVNFNNPNPEIPNHY